MKNFYSAVMAVLFIVVVFTISSCKKEQKAAVPPSTPDQQAKVEEMNKEIKQSVEQAKMIIVAQVNGVDITMLDLVSEMNSIARREEAKGQKEKNTMTVEQEKKEALDNLIFKELAVQEAIKQGIKVPPDRVDNIIKLMKEQAGSKEAFQKYLDEHQITEVDLRKRIERSQLFERITGEEIFQKIKLDDKQMRAYYGQHKSEFKDTAGKQLTYEETANFIRKKLISEKGAVLKKEWAKKLSNNASVVVFKEAMK